LAPEGRSLRADEIRQRVQRYLRPTLALRFVQKGKDPERRDRQPDRLKRPVVGEGETMRGAVEVRP
jgi:hypothetical protein